MKESFDVYVTRYALTKGIQKIRVFYAILSNSMVQDVDTKAYYHDEGRDWHRTYEAAVAKAIEMKQKKVKSLKKQLNKLEKLESKWKSEI